jgi:hypothetical protein
MDALSAFDVEDIALALAHSLGSLYPFCAMSASPSPSSRRQRRFARWSRHTPRSSDCERVMIQFSYILASPSPSTRRVVCSILIGQGGGSCLCGGVRVQRWNVCAVNGVKHEEVGRHCCVIEVQDAKVKHAGILSFHVVEECMMYNGRASPIVHALLARWAPVGQPNPSW